MIRAVFLRRITSTIVIDEKSDEENRNSDRHDGTRPDHFSNDDRRTERRYLRDLPERGIMILVRKE